MNRFRRLTAELTESCFIALEQIVANRGRSILTALGVIIGVIAATLMGTAIRAIDIGFDRSLSLLGDDVLYVEQYPWTPEEDFWSFRNRRTIQLSYVAQLNRLIEESPSSLLKLAVAAPNTMQTLSYKKRQLTNVYTTGTTSDFALLAATDCRKGRFLDDAESRGGRNVCVVGIDVANNLFGSDYPIEKIIHIAQQDYRVIGVFERQGSFLGVLSFDSQVVIPLASYVKYFDATGLNASIRVKVADSKRLDEARQELRGDFRRLRRLSPEQPDDFTINQQEAFRSTLRPVKAGLAVAGLCITSLSLFVGAIGIMNITFVSVKERTREIGTRKALGAKQHTILLQFLVEALSICLIGGVVGLLLSLLLLQVIATLLPSLPIEFSPGVVFVALTISSATGIISGFAPAWQASMLNPVDAIRYE
jgi:putative ABC transport system permease protein